MNKKVILPPITVVDPVFENFTLDSTICQLLSQPALASERARLEEQKNLGLISIIFPSATHTKWQHHLGMYHLAGSLPLNASDKEQLQRLALFGGIGHLPFGFPTEGAVLIAARTSNSFARKLQNLLYPVVEMYRKHKEIRADENPLAKMLNEYDYYSLHSWFTGLKIRNLPVDVKLGDREHLIFHRINNSSKIKQFYMTISRIDYVQRDLYYTGLARFTISPTQMFKHCDGSIESVLKSLEMSLINQMRHYLNDSLYYNDKVLALESMFKKELTGLLLEGQISIQNLLNSGDNSLLQTIRDKANRDLVNELRIKNVTTISTNVIKRDTFISDSSKTVTELQLEADISGISEKRIFNYHNKMGYLVSAHNKYIPEKCWGVALQVIDKPNRITPIAKSIMNLEKKWALYPYLIQPVDLLKFALPAQDLLTYLLDRSVVPDFKKFNDIFDRAFSVITPTLKREIFKARYILKPFIRRPYLDTYVNFIDWEDLEKLLPQLLFLPARKSELDAIRGPLFRLFFAALEKKAIDKAQFTETVVILNELLSLDGSLRKWVLPFVSFDKQTEQLTQKNETDAICVILKPNETLVKFIECSISDGDTKPTEDYSKLQRILDTAKKFPDLKYIPKIGSNAPMGRHFFSVDQMLAKFRKHY
jgi:HD superfamily phosphohydrolase